MTLCKNQPNHFFSAPVITGILFVFCLLMSSLRPALAHGPGLEEIDKLTAQIAESGEASNLYVKRARVYQGNGHWQEAMADFDKAAELDPEYVEYDLDRARLTLEAGEYLRTLDFIDLYLLRHRNTTEALLIRARSYQALEQYQQAAESFEFALADLSTIDGRPSPEWYLEFAETLVLTGDKEKAVTALREGIERLGPISVFQVKAAELEADLGLFDSALKRVDQLLNQSQRKDLWLSRRADILAMAGREDEAQRTYQQAYAALKRLPQRMQNLPVSRELADSLQARITQQ